METNLFLENINFPLRFYISFKLEFFEKIRNLVRNKTTQQKILEEKRYLCFLFGEQKEEDEQEQGLEREIWKSDKKHNNENLPAIKYEIE